MNKTEFLDAVRRARAEWDALISEIDVSRLEIPGVEGDWSIKDIIAHVTWYEREMVEVLRARALVGSPHWGLPSTDARNAAAHAETQTRSRTTVLSQSKEVYRQLDDALQTLTAEELVEAEKFRDMPDGWLPWQVFASNTYEHYPQHITSIRAWLDSTGAS